MKKFREDVLKKLFQNIQAGMTREDSCILAGIARDTFYTWLKEQPDFADKILKAETECKQRNVVRVQNHAKRDWRAAAWWLERKHKQEFASLSKLEHSGPRGAPLKVISTTVRPEVMKAMDEETLRKLAKKAPRDDGQP